MSVFTRPTGIQFSKSNPVSFILIILITSTYIADTLTGNALRSIGSLQGHLVIEHGEWWRVISVMLLHGNLTHYLFNTFFGIYVVGGALERMVGTWRYILFFLGGGILASFTVVGWDILFENFVPTIGASGAVFAVLGALLWITIHRSRWLDPSDISAIKTFVIINVVFTFLGANISIPGHIGGLISGYLLAVIIPINRPYQSRRNRMFNDPYEQTYIDPASLDDIEVVDDDDDDDDDFMNKTWKDYLN